MGDPGTVSYTFLHFCTRGSGQIIRLPSCPFPIPFAQGRQFREMGLQENRESAFFAVSVSFPLQVEVSGRMMCAAYEFVAQAGADVVQVGRENRECHEPVRDFSLHMQKNGHAFPDGSRCADGRMCCFMSFRDGRSRRTGILKDGGECPEEDISVCFDLPIGRTVQTGPICPQTEEDHAYDKRTDRTDQSCHRCAGS